MSDKQLFPKPSELVTEKQKDFVTEIPAGLTSRDDLFKALQDKLKLPNYFGHNWDALQECLEDLSWIKQRRVIIIHRDVPALKQKDIAEYRDVLATSSQHWVSSGEHELLVAFP